MSPVVVEGLVVKAPQPFTLALDAFCAAWGAAYDAAYLPSSAECRQLRVVIQRVPVSMLGELPGIFRRYLQDLDPFVAQAQRHSLMHFCTRGGINKYRVRAPVLSVKEARTMETLRNWEDEANGAHK